jgi:CBS-domain-containing membrane protein
MTVMKRSDTVDLILKQKSRDIVSVSPDQSVYEAIKEMADKEVGALLVISDGALVGIVSERELPQAIDFCGETGIWCVNGGSLRGRMPSPPWHVLKAAASDCTIIGHLTLRLNAAYGRGVQQ